jgi:hypothetical protein
MYGEWREINLGTGVFIDITINSRCFLFWTKLSAFNPRLMISAVYQFEHLGRSKHETTTNLNANVERG